MKTVTSKDGTTIAFDQYGTGAAIILIGGATQHRAGDPGTAQLAALLGQHFTVIHYDRRGRGDSTDTLPFAVEREIEDIDALIDAVGGSAFLFGNSSGGALALEAAIKLGSKVKKIAMYEVPYNDDPAARQTWKTYRKNLEEALAANRRGDAAALFLTLVGTPAAQIEGMRHAPVWSMFEALAPTLAYDHTDLLGEGASVPTEKAARVTVPALLLNGGASYPFMQVTAEKLAKAIPNAKHRVVEGQTHAVAPEILAPILESCFCW
jgi:pimeloyl-ACP methyl ester carboxylesterase